jgi:hypothetical protein
MPPRFVYWTIILDGQPTAFRSATRDELLPTFNRIRAKHPDAQLRYFARGKLWYSDEEAQAAIIREKFERREQHRGRDWRPGGHHKDPRDRFKVPRDVKRARFKARDHFHKPEGGSRKPEAEKWKPEPESRKPAAESRKPEEGSWTPAAGSRKPGAGSWRPPASSRKPQAGSWKQSAGGREPHAGSWKPAPGSRKPQAGSWKQSAGGRKPHAGSWKPAPGSRKRADGDWKPRPPWRKKDEE